jgi:hypothetical protein
MLSLLGRLFKRLCDAHAACRNFHVSLLTPPSEGYRGALD